MVKVIIEEYRNDRTNNPVNAITDKEIVKTERNSRGKKHWSR